MVLQVIVCQFLYVVVVNDLPMSEKGVTTYCSLRCVRSHAHVQAHTQISLRVQFIARAKS